MSDTLSSIDDESLMLLIQKQDHEAFTLLVERHTGRFYAAAFRMLGNEMQSEDIVQDAFLKIWNKPTLWKKGKGAKFTTWFYRIITNMCIDVIRKKKREVSGEVVESLSDQRKTQQQVMEDRQREEGLESAIQALPEKQKAALNLCFYEGLSNKEAADIMGVGVKALESLLMRAKAGVKDQLARKGLLEIKETA